MGSLGTFEIAGVGRGERFGEGPDVLLLSNPQIDPEHWTRPHVEALVAAGYSAVTFVHTGQHYGYSAVVDDVVQFITQLDNGPVRLFGWSQGAAIAQEVALADPDHVVASALVAPYGRQNIFDRVLQDAWDELAFADDTLSNVRLALQSLTAEPPARLGSDSYMADRLHVMRHWVDQPVDRERRKRSREFIDSYQHRLDALRGVAVPCLVVGFELDTDTFAERAREVASSIPDAHYVEIPGAGHLLPIMDPAGVYKPVIRFLQEADHNK